MPDLVNLTIDGIPLAVTEGTRILWAALDNDIYIPHLCAIREANPPLAACRLCLVEIEGWQDLVTSCTEPVAEGMVVRTNTPRVNRVRRTAFQLLLSNHPVNCAKCLSRGNCELQNIARYLGLSLRQRRFGTISRSLPVDQSHPLFTYDPNLCVLCGKCVWVCNEHSVGTLNFAFRGIETVVSTFANVPLAESSCNSCGECVAICPVGAFMPKLTKTIKQTI